VLQESIVSYSYAREVAYRKTLSHAGTMTSILTCLEIKQPICVGSGDLLGRAELEVRLSCLNARHYLTCAMNLQTERDEPAFAKYRIAVIIPCYKVEKEIASVLDSIPDYISDVIVVNDASPDGLRGVVEQKATNDLRIHLINHAANQGVGGAMVTGFRKAAELGTQVVVKMDGDGQMDARDIPHLVRPLIRGDADYTKGNRFRDFHALQQMPLIRRAGNMALSFMVKAATGYWTCFDPCNGFVAIRGDVLSLLPFEKIHHSYFFETSMLGRLYLINAVIKDVPIPARYGVEISNLSVQKVLWEFPLRLLACLMRRILMKNFIINFSMESVQLLVGLPMLLLGTLYGGYNWIKYYLAAKGAPTGTVVIPAMLIILGFQLLLSAINSDIQSVPVEPICGGALKPHPPKKIN
jgi:dolichol-phosphate mannosyltransferase